MQYSKSFFVIILLLSLFTACTKDDLGNTANEPIGPVVPPPIRDSLSDREYLFDNLVFAYAYDDWLDYNIYSIATPPRTEVFHLEYKRYEVSFRMENQSNWTVLPPVQWYALSASDYWYYIDYSVNYLRVLSIKDRLELISKKGFIKVRIL